MTFLVVLSAWGLLQWRGPSTSLHRDHWVHYWYLRASAALAALPLAPRLGLIVALPALLTLFISAVLAPIWAGVLLFFFSLLVLTYCLGRGDFGELIESYLERWQRGDAEAAFEKAIGLGLIPADARIDGLGNLHEQVRTSVLYRGYERWFAVVFWFVLLGAAGALAYRALQLLRRDGHASADERALLGRWLHWADWLPARLLGFTFAVMGNFAGCFRHWRGCWSSAAPAGPLLARFEAEALEVSMARVSVGGENFIARATDELREARALLGRSAVTWLVVLALLQLV